MAWWTSCWSWLNETSFAQRAEPRTAPITQTIATATKTPIGTTRLRRARSCREPLFSPAMCSCAEGTTFPPIARIWFASTIGKKDCKSLAVQPNRPVPRRAVWNRVAELIFREYCRGGTLWHLQGKAARRRPAFPQVGEIRLSRLDAIDQLGIADIAAHNQEVDRHADTQIGAHR